MADKSFMSQISDTVSSTVSSVSDTISSAVSTAKFEATKAYNKLTGQSTAGAGRGTTAYYGNIHAHNTDNIVPSSKDTYKLDFQANILDNYDVYTYHWKLFITPLKNATDGTVLETSSQTIIAESGVSDLTIDKVEVNGIAVPSVEAGTGTQTHVKFEIVEPAGAGLIDKMFYEAQALGIGNWLVMPCFLQLQFRGRDPKTSQSVVDGSPSDLSGLIWVWPIKLTNVKANVTTVGTRYEFDAVMYNELAQSNLYGTVQSTIILSNLKTFGEAMADLEKKLNADQWEKLIDNYSIQDTYRIVVDPKLASVPLINANADATKNTSRGADFVDLSKGTATFNAGTGIDKIVDNLLGSTATYEEVTRGAKTARSEAGPINSQIDQMKKLWRVVTETKPIAYDPLRQNNAVEMTIFIVEYDIGALDANASQTGQTPDTIPSAKKRLVEYINKGILRKKYNYIFTGLNDQIVSLDLNMNFAFAAALSRFGGIYTAGNDKGIAMQREQAEEKAATDMVRKTLQFINTSTDEKAIDAKVAETTKALVTAKISPINQLRYTTLLLNSKPAQRTAFNTKILQAGGFGAAGDTLATAASTAKSLASTPNSVRKFISDVNLNSSTVKDSAAIAQSTRKGKLRPIPYAETNQENNFIGTDTASNSGRSRTSSIFSTALYSTLDASMQKIKLTIKGDPYWLFPRSLKSDLKVLPYKSNMRPDQLAIDDIKKTKNNPNSVNLFGTDNFIILRFRTPRTFNETTGTVDPFTEVETFSGVYRVITIISKFEMGKFTQDLDCILDPVINIADFPEFLHDLEVASRQVDQVVPSTSTSLDVIPINSIKTQKILGTIEVPGQVATIRNAAGQVVTTAKDAQGFVTHITQAASNIPSDVGYTAAQQLSRYIPPIG